MKNLKHDLGLRLVKLLPVLFAVVPFGVMWYSYFADTIYRGNWVVIGLYLALYVIFARIYDAFLVSLNRISEMVYSQCLSVLISDCLIFVVIWLLNHNFPNLLPCVATLAVQLVLVSLWCLLAHKWYFRSFVPSKTAVVYDRRYHVESLLQEYGLEKKLM